MNYILLAIFIPITLLAQVNNGRISYEVKTESLLLSSEYLSRGIPLAPEFIIKSEAGMNAENLGEFFEQQTDIQIGQTEKTIELTKDALHSLPSDSTIHERKTKPLETKVDVDLYFNCLFEVAPYIRKYEALKRQTLLDQNSNETILNELALRIGRDRAIGGRANKEGQVCGKFLGSLSVAEFSDKLLLKYISVLKLISPENRKELLTAFVAVLHPDSPIQQRLILLHLLKYEMAKVYFFKEKSFHFSRLEETYLQLAKEASTQKTIDKYATQNIIVKTDWTDIYGAFQWAQEGLKK